jgi:hypothetical protein
MNNAINKDLVILALRRENEQLKKIEALLRKKEENTNKIIDNYELIIEAMKKQLQKEMETNKELNAKIEEITILLQSKIVGNPALPAQQ